MTEVPKLGPDLYISVEAPSGHLIINGPLSLLRDLLRTLAPVSSPTDASLAVVLDALTAIAEEQADPSPQAVARGALLAIGREL